MFNVSVNDKKNIYRSKPVMNVDTTGSSGNISIPKPLTYDYMPEGYPKMVEFTGMLMEEQSVTAEILITNPLVPIEGNTYTVNFDGTNYECVCHKYENIPEGETEPDAIVFYIGDPETGTPFTYQYIVAPSEGIAYGFWEFSGEQESHTISVQGTGIKAQTISANFLPTGDFSPYEPRVENTKKVYVAEYRFGGKKEDLYNEVETAYSNGYYVLLYYYAYNAGNNPRIYNLSKSFQGTFYFSYFGMIDSNVPIEVIKLYQSNGQYKMDLDTYYPYYTNEKANAPLSFYLKSSPSQKLFEIKVDDSGTISATEVT